MHDPHWTTSLHVGNYSVCYAAVFVQVLIVAYSTYSTIHIILCYGGQLVIPYHSMQQLSDKNVLPCYYVSILPSHQSCMTPTHQTRHDYMADYLLAV